MEIGKIEVSRADARKIYCGTLTAGMVGAEVAFSFDSSWDSLSKVAVFKAGRVVRNVMMQSDTVRIPPEVLVRPRMSLQVGIYGTNADGTVVIPTVWADVGRVEDGTDPSGDPSTDPTLAVWAQMLGMIGDLAWLNTEAKDNLVAAVNEVLAMGGAVDPEEIQRIVEGYLEESSAGVAIEKVADQTGGEMTEIWAELALLRSIVLSWPLLAEQRTWYKGSLKFDNLTDIRFVSDYATTGNEEESWNADAGNTGTITAYRTGTSVTVSANGAEKIRLAANAATIFCNGFNLLSISGLEMLDASMVENLSGAFCNDYLLPEVDISMWHLEKLTKANGVFNNSAMLRSVKFPRYGVPQVTSTLSLFDGCTNLAEVDLGRGLPVLSEKAFFKCLSLTAVSGLESVTAIGDRAFVYTPKLAAVDLRAKNITSIGESACRLSGVEDSVELSAVNVDVVGDMATRHKRWSAETLAELRRRKIPTVYIEVPNAENQDNYADIQFGTYEGKAVTVAEGGCTALTLYHEWNAIHAGTELEYASFRDWWNATIGATDFVANNVMDGNTITGMLEVLGWTSLGRSLVEGVAQLETIIHRLSEGLPVFASMHSANNVNGTHAVLIIGGDTNTRKLAVLDSHVVGTDATVSWLAFEDIFVEGSGEYDYIEPFAYGEG